MPTGRMDGDPPPHDEEDDVTDPATPPDVPEADRAEQEALLDPLTIEDVPEADALEQQLAARPGEAGSPLQSVGDREANEADVLEQAIDVPVDDEEPS